LLLSSGAVHARTGSGGSAVPRNPSIVKRLFGRGHPAGMSAALQRATQMAPSSALRKQLSTAIAAKQQGQVDQLRGKVNKARGDALAAITTWQTQAMSKGQLSPYSARALAKKAAPATQHPEATDKVLQAYTSHYMKGLSVRQIGRLAKKATSNAARDALLNDYAKSRQLSVKEVIRVAKKTKTYSGHNDMLLAYAERNIPQMSVPEVIRLAKATAKYVKPHNTILNTYKAAFDGALSQNDIKRLDRARAVPSDGSSSSGSSNGLLWGAVGFGLGHMMGSR
jgi:hypothetical protein